MDVSYLGESAALGTACCWAITALAFESAGKRVGSLPVNLIRLLVASILLVPVVWVRHGSPLPLDAPRHAWTWLGLSGLVGFTLGDLCLFRAFVLIGARLSMLMMALAPPLAALLGFVALGETLAAKDWVGMTMTLTGVAWVIVERAPAADRPSGRPSWVGVLLGLGGATGQAVGLILSKHGMADYDAFAANQIRVLAAIAGFAVIFTASGMWPRVGRAVRHGHAMTRITIGAVFGPFLGVSLSLVAVQHTAAGIAATIMSITPVVILPVSRWGLGERVTRRAVLGAILAVAGTAVLFR